MKLLRTSKKNDSTTLNQEQGPSKHRALYDGADHTAMGLTLHIVKFFKFIVRTPIY